MIVRTPHAVLQFRVLELLCSARSPLGLHVIVNSVDDADRDIETAVFELEHDGYLTSMPMTGETHWYPTPAGRELVAPKAPRTHAEALAAARAARPDFASLTADERAAAVAPTRWFPGDSSSCFIRHVRGSKPTIVPVAGTGEFMVHHGADYLDRTGRVSTQGTDRALLAMTHDEAADAIVTHELAVAHGLEPAGVIVRDTPDRAGNSYRATLDHADDGAEVGPWVRTVEQAARILHAALQDGPTDDGCGCGHDECGAC